MREVLNRWTFNLSLCCSTSKYGKIINNDKYMYLKIKIQIVATNFKVFYASTCMMDYYVKLRPQFLIPCNAR